MFATTWRFAVAIYGYAIMHHLEFGLGSQRLGMEMPKKTTGTYLGTFDHDLNQRPKPIDDS